MKKLVSVFALVSLLAGSAFAITDEGDNSLGVYFDSPNFNQNCFEPTPFTPFNMYFVLANPEFANMGGFEFGWRFAPTLSHYVLSATFPPQALNIGTNYNIICGLGGGLPTSEATVLVTLNVMVQTAPGETFISVGPAQPASIPGHAVFNNFAAPDQLVSMNFATVDGVDVTIDNQGWVAPGVAALFCPGPVATEEATWSSVKALFE